MGKNLTLSKIQGPFKGPKGTMKTKKNGSHRSLLSKFRELSILSYFCT